MQRFNSDHLGDAGNSMAALLTAAQRTCSLGSAGEAAAVAAAVAAAAAPSSSGRGGAAAGDEGEGEGEALPHFAGSYLANVSPSLFRELFEAWLPDTLTGAWALGEGVGGGGGRQGGRADGCLRRAPGWRQCRNHLSPTVPGPDRRSFPPCTTGWPGRGLQVPSSWNSTAATWMR